MEGRVPGLVGHMCPNFGIGKPGVRERDTDLVEIMLAEYRQFIESKNMPQFIIMSLGEDHTDGTRPGSYTPESCVGSNDQALGKLVDAVSHGPLWSQTAIFVIEDDAQNGPDHVDAHRTVSLVISPYTKRGYVDSTQYSTVSMIRTMELILRLATVVAVRRGGQTDVRELYEHTGFDTVYTCRAADGSKRQERGHSLWSRSIDADGFH